MPDFTVTADQGAPNTPANAWPVTLYDAAGNQIAVLEGQVAIATQRGLVFAGQSDGGTYQFANVDTAGAVRIQTAATLNSTGLAVADRVAADLLQQVLIELRRLNFTVSCMADVYPTVNDVT